MWPQCVWARILGLISRTDCPLSIGRTSVQCDEVEVLSNEVILLPGRWLRRFSIDLEADEADDCNRHVAAVLAQFWAARAS